MNVKRKLPQNFISLWTIRPGNYVNINYLRAGLKIKSLTWAAMAWAGLADSLCRTFQARWSDGFFLGTPICLQTSAIDFQLGNRKSFYHWHVWHLSVGFHFLVGHSRSSFACNVHCNCEALASFPNHSSGILSRIRLAFPKFIFRQFASKSCFEKIGLN